MAIQSKNTVLWAAIAALNAATKATIGAINGSPAAASPPPAGSPTAPSIVGTPQMAFNNGVGTPLSVTLTGIQTGDLIFAISSTYQYQTNVAAAVTAPGVTFSKVLATDISMGYETPDDLTFNAFTAVAGSSGSMTITTAGGDYKGLSAFRIQNYDAAIFDIAPVSQAAYATGNTAFTTTLPTTTYSHDLILYIVCWYESANVNTISGDWPVLVGGSTISNNGSNDQNQMLVLGKQVTTTGVYAPTLTTGVTSGDTAGIAIAIKGKSV